ncbi:MAG TPA: glycosyltransferase family 2 protein [Thermoanaerobaculia bacterium]|jgi:GT2 family glycosyltransferase|nr:glycosyltransferase family 2 protein [Thermoanaerobaculia bacterium]
MSKNDVAAVIVTFNSAATIHECIRSVLASPAVREVVIVDNRSADDTLARIATFTDDRLRVITMPENVGFSRGVNRGVAETTSPLLAIVNPDAACHDGTIEILRDAIASREFWAAGPALINSRGLRERSARAFPVERNALLNWRYLQAAPRTKNKHVASFLMLDRDLHDTFACDWLSGAFILAWRDVFDELGGFDPSYFLYYEDVDLFRRARNRGYVCCYVGATSADHAIGHSSNTIPIRAGLRRVAGFIRYYRTHVRTSILSDIRLAFYLAAGILFLEVLAPLRSKSSVRHRA